MRPSEAGTQYPLPRIQLGNTATRTNYKHTRALATALPMEATLFSFALLACNPVDKLWG
jgi:hypothetical protein